MLKKIFAVLVVIFALSATASAQEADAPIIEVDKIKSVGEKSPVGELISFIELEEALVNSGKFRVIEHVIHLEAGKTSLKPEYIFRGKIERKISGEQSAGTLTVSITLDVQLRNAKTKKIVWENSVSKEEKCDGSKEDVGELDLTSSAVHGASQEIVENLVADMDSGKVSL